MAALRRYGSSTGPRYRGGLGALALWLCGCAHGSPSAPQVAPVEGELRAQLEQQLAERDGRIRELENRMALLEAEAREIRDRLAHAQPAPGLRETVRIGAHVREERAEREQAGPRPVLRLHGEATAADAPRRKSQREPLPPLPESPAERLPVAPLPPPSVESMEGAPADSRQAYREALGLLRDQDFDRALAALSAFLVRYPGDPRTADVLFWRGEVQFALADFEGALASFHGALAARLSSERAPDALLKVGLCHRELGAHEQARAALERLKSQFPKSRAARLVSQEDAS